MQDAHYYNEELKRISWLDKRYYGLPGSDLWFPSVTTILNAYPKGPGLDEWIKDLGHNAKFVIDRAAKDGTAVHDLIERALKGEEVKLMNQYGNLNHSIEVWGMFMKFCEFWEQAKPELIACEANLVSKRYRMGGTLDLVCRIYGQVWLIDFKTSNGIYDTYYMQLAAYRNMWNEVTTPDRRIVRNGILWLKAATRGEDGKGKSIQGKGWQVKESPEDHEYTWQQFLHTQAIWEHQNPNYKPYVLDYPTTVKLVV